MKIWSIKSLSGKKRLNFLPSPITLHNLIYPRENTKSQIISSEFLTFTPMSFDITTELLLSPWCIAAFVRIRAIRGNFSPPQYYVKFVNYDRLVFICFYRLFIMSWELDVSHSKISKTIKC